MQWQGARVQGGRASLTLLNMLAYAGTFSIAALIWSKSSARGKGAPQALSVWGGAPAAERCLRIHGCVCGGGRNAAGRERVGHPQHSPAMLSSFCP